MAVQERRSLRLVGVFENVRDLNTPKEWFLELQIKRWSVVQGFHKPGIRHSALETCLWRQRLGSSIGVMPFRAAHHLSRPFASGHHVVL